jgi:hypothetical protein
MAEKKTTKKAAAAKKKTAKKDDDEGVKYVRGGAICNPSDKSPKLIRGSGSAAVCRSTSGTDPRPRYRRAGS